MVSEADLEGLLRDLACPSALHEIRALMLGCLAHAEGIPVDRLHRRIWQGIEPDFRSGRQVEVYASGLVGLWEMLTPCRRGAPVRLAPLSGSNASDVARRVRVRMEEVHAFIAGLRVVPPAGSVLPSDVGFALLELRRATEMLEWVGRAAHLAAARGPAGPAGDVRGMAGAVSDMERVVERAMSVIVRRPAAGREPADHTSRPPTPKARVWTLSSLDPCPCGSGFPVGVCCSGRATNPT